VEHYDLQTELVDHIGNGIEEQWAKNPDIPFQTALQCEFRKFGVFGFHDIIAEKTKAMEKKYLRILWSFFRAYFKPPGIVLFLALTLAVFTLMIYLNKDIRGYAIAVLFAGTMCVFFVKSLRNREKIKNKDKKWLMEDMILNHGNFILYFNFAIQICIYPRILDEVLQNPILAFVFAFLLTGLALLFYLMVFKIPLRTEDFLIQTYPEYKMGQIHVT
jgi:hypothetical protein